MPIAPQQPSSVTRFYGNVTYAMEVLEGKTITFVHSSLLNDPFDPYCFFETDFDDSYHGLLTHVQQNHQRDLPWFGMHVTPQSWTQTVLDLKAYLHRLRETAFILSTSAASSNLHPKDNLYMWGHYANGHRGIALEFNTAALTRAVLAHHSASNGTPFEEADVWARIEYAKTFAPMTAEDVYEYLSREITKLRGQDVPQAAAKLATYYNRMSIIKSEVWQSENEWRLMWQNDEPGTKIYKCPVGADAIAGICVGLNISPTDLERVLSARSKHFPAVPIRRARKRRGDLALEFDAI